MNPTTPVASAARQPSASQTSSGFTEPAIDGLRWFAVALVMLAHFSPTLGGYADWGTYGVNLFFVLSGFLITTILLRARGRIEARASTPAPELWRFHLRRVFRLWPVYFTVLAAAYAGNIGTTRSSIWWHLTFLSNQYILHIHAWPGLLSHLWSLAVEQQYYLFWSAIVLWTPSRLLPRVMVALIAIGPAARWLLWVGGLRPESIIMVPLPCCLDLFGAGGFLAWMRLHTTAFRFPRVASAAALLGLTGWIALDVGLTAQDLRPGHWIIYNATVQALAFAILLAHVLATPTGRFTRFLRWSPWVYLGTISYSIYLMHNFMHRLGPSVLRRIAGFNYFQSEWAHVAYLSGLSMIAATLSFYVLEKPMRALGRKLAR